MCGSVNDVNFGVKEEIATRCQHRARRPPSGVLGQAVVALTTPRLDLRRLTSVDLPAVAALHADAEVMRYFPACLTLEQSARFVEHSESTFERHGFGVFAVEWRHTHEFAGCVGLMGPSFAASFTPCVEVMWRVCRSYWAQGVATEAAHALLKWGFAAGGLSEVVAFTYTGNLASRRVMEKLGMSWDVSADFEHPRLPVGHWLRPHVLYRSKRNEHAMAGGTSP